MILLVIFQYFFNFVKLNNKNKFMKIKKITIAVLFLSAFITYGQKKDSIKTEKNIDDVVLTGSRNKKRTVVNSAVPVDVIEVKQLSQTTGQVEINQLLQFSAPSFNSNKQSGSDGADAVDPATLRGLGPDQTLVLLNVKKISPIFFSESFRD